MKTILSVIFILTLLSYDMFGQGLNFDQDEYDKLDKIRVTRADKYAPSYSLKQYAPHTIDQGDFSTCVAISFVTARAMIFAIEKQLENEKDFITANLLSPNWIYQKVKDPYDSDCSEGLGVSRTINLFYKEELMMMKDVEYPEYYPFSTLRSCKVWQFSRVNDLIPSEEPPWLQDVDWKLDKVYAPITAEDVKLALNRNHPVIIGMHMVSSFQKAEDLDHWQPTQAERELVETKNSKKKIPGHAMVIVGYDENKYGGAFEILNSYGRQWGNGGYIWVSEKDIMNYRIAFWALQVDGDSKSNRSKRTNKNNIGDGKTSVKTDEHTTSTMADNRFQRVAELIKQLK